MQSRPGKQALPDIPRHYGVCEANNTSNIGPRTYVVDQVAGIVRIGDTVLEAIYLARGLLRIVYGSIGGRVVSDRKPGTGRWPPVLASQRVFQNRTDRRQVCNDLDCDRPDSWPKFEHNSA